MDADAPVFAIAVAAELAGMHPQTLRQYDRIGLVVPGRTRGGSRRYSMRNIEQLREVAQLSSEGMSLPAIARLLDLEDEVRMLRRRVVELEGALRAERENRPGVRVFAAGSTGSIVPVGSGRRIRRSTEVVLWHPRSRRDDDDPESEPSGA
ncbi:heat shock protein transcriptional repressor HspR [Microbacterium esteraromaticum]|uniref:heat shock protein transcriptional repressor HspR n=1 Tax=Microbacterium esteraromaticum TaxID=57043 RepID=UPI0019D3A630|nr:MerR family transcriptional regulator [Microbacterium esteraromaticum]MBN7794157.1 MerR family transcriptional regulator [Microbacterium esteraromaticum]